MYFPAFQPNKNGFRTFKGNDQLLILLKTFLLKNTHQLWKLFIFMLICFWSRIELFEFNPETLKY